MVDVEKLLYKLMDDRPDSVANIAIAARRTVLEMAPGCSELVYKSYAVSEAFTFTGKLGQAFIHIATYSGHVNLGFNCGADLIDEQELLKGSGKHIRHIRLESESKLRRAPVKQLIRLAIEQGREMANSKGGIQAAIFVNNTSSSY